MPEGNNTDVLEIKKSIEELHQLSIDVRNRSLSLHHIDGPPTAGPTKEEDPPDVARQIKSALNEVREYLCEANDALTAFAG